MKNERGVTLVALIITIIVMVIIIGITVSAGGNLLQKSRITDYIGYMELVKARADDVLEEDMFNKKDVSTDDEFIEKIDKDGKIEETITTKGYNNNTYTRKVWDKNDIFKEGIDQNILGNEQYFIIVFDNGRKETVDVIYTTGCELEGKRYYTLSDMKNVISENT